MKKYVPFVDVFQGNGDSNEYPTVGVASSWHPIKVLSGNTHPAAQLPFGRISVGCYSGAYPCGCGINMPRSQPRGNQIYKENRVIGLSHLHHSGVGAIGYYYNYAVATAFFGALSKPEAHPAEKENAKPGYYSVFDAENGIVYEATVDPTSGRHRYTFPHAGGRISVNLANDGLLFEKYRKPAGDAKIWKVDDSTVTAEVILQGRKLYFALICEGASVSLWKDYRVLSATDLEVPSGEADTFGCVFDGIGKTAELKIAISLKSVEKALADARVSTASFEELCKNAEQVWETALSAIDVQADEAQKRIFYSNFYHTLVKPSDFSGENLFDEQDDFMVDFSTLWDIYKTQLPLLFTLYPEVSRKICRTYTTLSDTVGVMPNAFGLCASMNVESKQARLLSAYLFCDAFYREVPGVDYSHILDALCRELSAEEYRTFFEDGACERTTYTLDVAEACGNLADMATALGRVDVADRLSPHAGKVWNAFDTATGLLKDGYDYYEGNLWNYSFRPMRDNEARVALCGEEHYVALLDRFFGFADASDTSARFEGFNNETDMEAPYAYAFAGRHDRICEIMEGMRQLFVSGGGGIPGNADSGGLTACYIWNSLGLFPVTGQNLMLIGVPSFERAVVKLAGGNTLSVIRQGRGIYVKDVWFRGERVEDLFLSVTDMMRGGELVFWMTEDKSDCRLK